MNASNWKDGKAKIAKMLYKVQSYGKTFYEYLVLILEKALNIYAEM